MDIINMLSDSSINLAITTLLTKYKILTALLSGSIFWVARKIVKLTPWKSDDILIDKLAKKLNINET